MLTLHIKMPVMQEYVLRFVAIGSHLRGTMCDGSQPVGAIWHAAFHNMPADLNFSTFSVDHITLHKNLRRTVLHGSYFCHIVVTLFSWLIKKRCLYAFLVG